MRTLHFGPPVADLERTRLRVVEPVRGRRGQQAQAIAADWASMHA
jgi:hypothetical protein